jgi:predicted transcriptional regulator
MERTAFGDWVFDQLAPHGITVVELSDYSGIHVRSLYRLLNGETVLKVADWLWLCECIADMTNADTTQTVKDSAEYLLAHK